MAKSKPDKRAKKNKKGGTKLTFEMSAKFLDQAIALLHTGQPDEALPIAEKALKCLSTSSNPEDQLLAIELIGEIYIELGEPGEARQQFLQAAALDPQGLIREELGGGADKFMWLAQLCEDGGGESVQWFEKGCAVLRREIRLLEDNAKAEPSLGEIKKRKLANALCGAAEVYMTDLS